MRKAASYHSGGQRPPRLGSRLRLATVAAHTDGYVVVPGPSRPAMALRGRPVPPPVRCAPITRGARAGRSSRTRSDAAVPALCCGDATTCRVRRLPVGTLQADSLACLGAGGVLRCPRQKAVKVFSLPGNTVSGPCSPGVYRPVYLPSGPFRPVGRTARKRAAPPATAASSSFVPSRP